MKIKVRVDDKLCIGSGNCIIIASEHFNLDENGKAVINNGDSKAKELILEVKNSDKEKLIAAARACPAQAIQLVDEEGNEIS